MSAHPGEGDRQAALSAAQQALDRLIAAYRARQADLWRDCGPEIARATERVFVARRASRAE